MHRALGAIRVGVFDGGGAHLGPRGIELSGHMRALWSLDHKLRKYMYDHAAQETAKLEGKTINDLVSLGILSREDEAYIYDHRITFDGYRGGQHIPMFTETVDTELNYYRFIIYSDGNGHMEALHP